MEKEIILDLLLNTIEEGVHVLDKHGSTLFYNRAMANIEGLKTEEVMEKKLLDIMPSLESNSTHIKVLKTGKPIKNKYQEYFNKKGRKISTINSTYPIEINKQIVGSLEIANDITKIRELSDKVIELNKLNEKSNRITKYTFEDIIGVSNKINDLKNQCKRIARTSSSIVIVGESGTGKEIFAQSIHNESRRKDKPFVAENCAAIPSNLLESILFGTTKGSFTGAENKQGLFMQANGGTLLLDEINSMPLLLQSKLLRVLQTGKFRPLGSEKEIKVNVRIIAIANKDLYELVKERKFREDLFYRLSVVNITVPPLRERKEDIEILMDYFLKYYEKIFNMKIRGIDDKVIKFFTKYSWPGNVRELQHAIEGAVSLLENNQIFKMEQLPYYMKKYDITSKFDDNNNIEENINKMLNKELTLYEYLKEIEKKIILSIMNKTNSNITRTANILGIKRQGLQYKLKHIK